MKITLSPTKGLPGQPKTEVSVSGDTITVDGTPYDLSAIPEGGEATPQGDGHPFVGKITRKDNEINCKVLVVLGDDAKPRQPVDPEHWVVTVKNGEVKIPYVKREK